MRFRAAVTSVLAVMLLSLSSFASSCEIRCDLAKVGPSCHADQAGEMPAMAGMKHQQTLSAGAIFLAAPHSCGHRMCAPQPALSGERRSGVVHALSGMQSVLPEVVLFLAIAQERSIPDRGPPLFRMASPVTLHTSLRV